MSLWTVILIAIVAAFIGFAIGFCIGYTTVPHAWKPNMGPNSVTTFDVELPIPAVTSKVVLSKRISKSEYTKAVNACLKDAVTKAVNVWVSVIDKSEKRRIINAMYAEWHEKLPELAYSKYNPEFQRLDIVGHKTSSAKSDYSPYSLRFDAVWSPKEPYDRPSSSRRNNK